MKRHVHGPLAPPKSFLEDPRQLPSSIETAMHPSALILLTLSTSTALAMAPSAQTISQIFAPLAVQGQQSRFFEHVADDVQWTIMGHSPLSRAYTSKADFYAQTIEFLGQEIVTEPLTLTVHNVVAGEGSEWAAVEMTADATCRNGLKYDMVYNWVCRFAGNDTIVEVRAYLDTKLLSDAVEQNFPWRRGISGIAS